MPGRLLVFRTVKAPEGFPDFDTYAKVVSAFELEPAGDGRTRVRLTGTGYADNEAGRRLLGFFESGNQASLDALKARFAEVGARRPPLRAELEPLRFLARPLLARRDQERRRATRIASSSVFGGQHVRDRHEVNGGAPYRGETLYSWDGAAKRVDYVYWNSSGGVSRGHDGGDAEALDFGDETYTGAGRARDHDLDRLAARSTSDAYEAVTTSGADPTGERVVRFTRVD